MAHLHCTNGVGRLESVVRFLVGLESEAVEVEDLSVAEIVSGSGDDAFSAHTHRPHHGPCGALAFPPCVSVSLPSALLSDLSVQPWPPVPPPGWLAEESDWLMKRV